MYKFLTNAGLCRIVANLKLLLAHRVLEEGEKGRYTVVAVVEQHDGALWIHALADKELVVRKGRDNLLDDALDLGLKDGHTSRVGLLKVLLDGLHVALDVRDK